MDDCLRQGHGEDAAAGAGEGVGDIVVLREDGLGERHGGRGGVGPGWESGEWWDGRGRQRDNPRLEVRGREGNNIGTV